LARDRPAPVPTNVLDLPIGIPWLNLRGNDRQPVRETRAKEGKAMLKARDMMTKDVVTATPDMEITQAARLLLENHFNGLPVVDDKGRLIGIICQDDLIVQQKKLPLPSLFTFFDGLIPLTSYRSLEKEVDKIVASKVSQAMTSDPITIDPDTSLEDIATLMVSNNVHTLPVVEGGRLVGIIGKEDVLRTLMPSASQD
jgi:CBS domain-containing protein